MTTVCYLASGTEDLEERIEEDMLSQALAELLPSMQVSGELPVPGTVLLGRVHPRVCLSGDYPWPTMEHLQTDYWNWPVFLRNAGRSFTLLDWDGAIREVDRLLADGKDVFVKATDDKLLAMRLPSGSRLADALGDMAYSFLDRGPCLMVQEAVPMAYEYRLLVLGGKPVTGAGVVMHHTPRDNVATFDPKMVRDIRNHHEVENCPARVERYLEFARGILAETGDRSFSLDVAEVDGRPVVVEFNPLMPGRIGLYASDVAAFAAAVVDHLDGLFGIQVPALLQQ